MISREDYQRAISMSKGDILSILKDLGACEKQIEYLKNDCRQNLLDIYEDSWILDEHGDPHQSGRGYELGWIHEGPGRELCRYDDDHNFTFEQTMCMLYKEHELWRNDRDEWVRLGGET